MKSGTNCYLTSNLENLQGVIQRNVGTSPPRLHPSTLWMIVSPDTRSRSELLTDIDLMETLKSGAFTKDHGFPRHEHVTDFPGHDWKDVSLPPTQAVARDGEPGAWKCTNLHARGDYYMSGDRSTCSGCSASKTASAEEMDWTLDCGGPRTGFVIFVRETSWIPRDGAGLTRTSHNTLAQLMCELLVSRFPSLTMRDIRPYVCRPVKFRNQKEVAAVVRALRD